MVHGIRRMGHRLKLCFNINILSPSPFSAFLSPLFHFICSFPYLVSRFLSPVSFGLGLSRARLRLVSYILRRDLNKKPV